VLVASGVVNVERGDAERTLIDQGREGGLADIADDAVVIAVDAYNAANELGLRHGMLLDAFCCREAVPARP
jgi:hypothetical protein